MNYLIKTLLGIWKSAYREIIFINGIYHLFKMIDEDIPISVIADAMTRSSKKGLTPDDVRNYVKALETLGYREKTILVPIIDAFNDSFKLIYFTFISLFSRKIITMDKFEKILDEINLLSDLRLTENKIHANLIYVYMNCLAVSREDYELAVSYLNDLKSK